MTTLLPGIAIMDARKQGGANYGFRRPELHALLDAAARSVHLYRLCRKDR